MEGCLVWGGGVPSPEIFLILDLKMSTSSAFWALFLQFSYLLYVKKTMRWGLENLLLHANRQQKAIKQAVGNYTVSHKNCDTLTMAITLSILGRFAKFFRCCKER